MARPLKILVADDDEGFRDELLLSLGSAGYDVAGVENGAFALRSLEAHRVDILLTDWLMPEMDGVELVRAVRGRWPKVKIVAISSGGSMEWSMVSRAANAFGVDDILQKPVSFGDLLRTIQRLSPPE